ncbi:urease accessory protein UreE [Dactylosporangium sp. NPDC005572]|uniref:urease accessory protein UreE n=1 Tax=Dactylosporangium sp. NPDC005572 TaxID=3156889 RepID=UPI0033A74913
MRIESVLGNLDDPRWRGDGAPARTDVLWLEQWEARQSQVSKFTDGGVEVTVSLPPGTRLHDGDVLWSDPDGTSVIVARLDLGEIMLIELPRPDPVAADSAIRVALELGHALGHRHWPAVVKGDQVYVPVVPGRDVMDALMRGRRFAMIPYRFLPGAEVVPYLAPHEARRLFGDATGAATG